MKSGFPLALFLVATIFLMILPVPSWLVDVGLAGSFALAVLIFTVVVFVEKPLDFSGFPTAIVACLMLRLALNVSSTKLIIQQGHTGSDAAGTVIAAFSSYVMSGSVLLGVVIFLIFLVVNFVVINKGASRMAEVGARFALDAMPGKQLAIDSDLSNGVIDHDQAVSRRKEHQDEAAFYGSLDGTSKFVKGDAIAGLLISLINISVGVLVGLLVHGLSFEKALETYAILTVGDGLVSQIPAIIVSISTAILLARGGLIGTAGGVIFRELSRFPRALLFAGTAMLLFAFLPGLPFLPFFLGGATLSFLGVKLVRSSQETVEPSEPVDVSSSSVETMSQVLELDSIHVEFSSDLVDLVLDPGTGLDQRIDNMRTHLARSFGIIVPEIRLTDNVLLEAGTYVCRVQGTEVARDTLFREHVLNLQPYPEAIEVESVEIYEPVYGANARWVPDRYVEELAMAGGTIITPMEVLATHLLEIIKDNFSRLLTVRSVRRLIDERRRHPDASKADEYSRIFDEYIPDKVPIDCLHAVLRLLLDERVSIRNIELIIEAIGEVRPHTVSPDMICEHVRQRLGFQIVSELKREDGSIPLLQLADEWEDTFQNYQVEGDRGVNVALPPDLFTHLTSQLTGKLSDAENITVKTAIICNSRRRRFLRTVLKAKGLKNPVLSYEELGVDARPVIVGIIAS